MVSRDVIAMYSKSDTKRANTECGQNVEYCNVAAGYACNIVIVGL
jgi:hypothetical protein